VGSIYFLTDDRLRPVNVSVLTAMSCVMRLGVGSRELLDAATQVQISPTNGPKSGDS
jgi:hypothetical protein